MTKRILVFSTLLAVCIGASSDHAAALDCVESASTTFVLALESIELVGVSGDVVAERARIGETAELIGARYGGSEDASPADWVRLETSVGTLPFKRSEP